MAKLDIDFVLIDESVVRNGFRALMSGAQLDEFKANPVMLFMHNRAEGLFEGRDKDAILPIGAWYDIRVKGNQLLAKPDFDDNDDFAKQIESKVKGGYLRGTSIWIDPIAASDESSLMLPGQMLPTFTKWGVLEASVVDIPNCKNALAKRENGSLLKLYAGTNDDELTDYLKTLNTNSNTSNMDKKLLAVKLGLNESADDTVIAARLTAVLTDANNASSFKTEVDRLKVDLAAKDTEISAIKLSADAAKGEALVQGAVDAKKIPATDKEKYLKLAGKDYDTTKELIDSINPYQSVEQIMTNAGNAASAEVQELMKLSGRDLYMQGKLERLKQLSVEHFKLKYKDYYGLDYKG